MKHVFYVVYILFYTGAVFAAGMFLGQMLERTWAAREKTARPASAEPVSAQPVSNEALRAQPNTGIPISDHKMAISRKQ